MQLGDHFIDFIHTIIHTPQTTHSPHEDGKCIIETFAGAVLRHIRSKASTSSSSYHQHQRTRHPSTQTHKIQSHVIAFRYRTGHLTVQLAMCDVLVSFSVSSVHLDCVRYVSFDLCQFKVTRALDKCLRKPKNTQ